MRKIRLNLDAIQVDSFRTSREAAWTGTVRGHFDEADTVFYAYEEGEALPDTETCGDTTAPPPPPPPRTLPPALTCDTCYRTCITACTCPTNLGCTGCT